MAGLVSNQHL